jgi:hypothetical protein
LEDAAFIRGQTRGKQALNRLGTGRMLLLSEHQTKEAAKGDGLFSNFTYF